MIHQNDYSFLRASEQHCPNCGHLGEIATRIDLALLVCKSCKTEYTHFMVLSQGEQNEGENN